MKFSPSLSYLITILAFVVNSILAQAELNFDKPSQETQGKLLLLGGGITDEHVSLIKRFSDSDSIGIVVIPTAMSDEEINKDPTFSKVHRRMSRLGFEKVQILHTRESSVANSDEFVTTLNQVNGVLMLGGNTPRLLEAYRGTRTHYALSDLLERGGMVAGVSAGSGAIASFFFKKELKEGFQLLENVVVMNHFLARNKQFEHMSEIKRNSDKIAIGIDDNTGILVQGDRFEVVGKSYVAIYDKSFYDRSNDFIYTLPSDSERFYLLKNGERYNLGNRTIETNSRLTPLSLSANELEE